jgi:WD40 repeat protein
VTSVAWSPDGTRISSASATVRVWNALTGDTIFIYREHAGFQKLVAAVAWSPDGALIASVGGGDEQAIHIWDAANGGPISIYHGHTKHVNALAWSPDGAQIASASDTVQVWDAVGGDSVAMGLIREDARVSVIKYPGHTRFWRRNNAVHAIAWSPDGAYIASSGADKTVQVWHARQPFQHIILTYRGHTLPVSCVAWSPDGTLIASGSGDGTVQVWDSTNGDLFFTYDGHSGSQVWIKALAWSPDGMRIASASGGSDETIHVWNALDGGNVSRYSGHTDCTNALAWSPDGTRSASASQDGSVQVWQAV